MRQLKILNWNGFVNGLKDRDYLVEANRKLPKGWRLMESQRKSGGSGRTTFYLYLVRTTTRSACAWPVFINMPRRILREFVKVVERDGLRALVAPGYATYTSRFSEKGYEEETLGLREALYHQDPSLVEVWSKEVKIDDVVFPAGEQIYPWGMLMPGEYRIIPTACGGCDMHFRGGGERPLQGHFACSREAFDLASQGAEIVGEELIEGQWRALVRVE